MYLIIRANGYRPRVQKMPGAASLSSVQCPPHSSPALFSGSRHDNQVQLNCCPNPTELPALLDLLAVRGRPLALSLRWRQDTGSVSHLNAAECFVFEAEKMAYSVGSRAPFPLLTLWLFLHVTGKCL